MLGVVEKGIFSGQGFSAWALDHQHHWEHLWNANSPATPGANWIRTSGYGTHSLRFNKHFRWFWCGLTFENHYFRIRETLDKNLTIGHQEDSIVSLSFGRCLKIDWAHPKSNEFIMLQEHRLLAMGSVLRRNFEQVNGG